MPVAIVRDVVTQGGQQERSKSSSRLVDAIEAMVFEQIGEIALCEILRFLATMAASAQIRVQRIPVQVTQGGQRWLTVERGLALRLEDQTPSGRHKIIHSAPRNGTVCVRHAAILRRAA